jgi:DNA (cytosine-5)-methyltransferase 1
MTHGSLFSGIGGFDWAAKEVGWENKFYCEINEYCQQALKHHFPYCIEYGAIESTDFTFWNGKINVLSGGFPCQDASNANQKKNRKKGLEGARTGLFWEMLRAIGEIRPDFVVAENVANILKVNEGRDFSTILTELSRMGYNAEWRVCYASEKGAPHKRKRLYLVAYPGSFRLQKGETFIPYSQEEIKPFCWNVAGTTVSINRGGAWNVEPPVPCVDDGVPGNMVRSAIQAYGNAIVPKIAIDIFKSINEIYYSI